MGWAGQPQVSRLPCTSDPYITAKLYPSSSPNRSFSLESLRSGANVSRISPVASEREQPWEAKASTDKKAVVTNNDIVRRKTFLPLSHATADCSRPCVRGADELDKTTTQIVSMSQKIDQIILPSSSPRRAQLLESLAVTFVVA